jgi:hypothetical protein
MLNAVVAPATGSMHGVRHTNPLAIQALSHPTWRAVIQGISVIAVAGLAVVALAPLVRFRRAGPVQRQQLKWFAFVVDGRGVGDAGAPWPRTRACRGRRHPPHRVAAGSDGGSR